MKPEFLSFDFNLLAERTRDQQSKCRNECELLQWFFLRLKSPEPCFWGMSRHMSKVCKIISKASCAFGFWAWSRLHETPSVTCHHSEAMSYVLHMAERVPSISKDLRAGLQSKIRSAYGWKTGVQGHSTMAPLMCIEKAVSCLSKVPRSCITGCKPLLYSQIFTIT